MLAWRLSNTLTTDFCLETVQEALTRYGTPEMHIPTKSAADSERIRPPIGAPRRRASDVCPRWPASVQFGQPFSHGFSFQGDLIGVVHEPVKNSIREGRLADGRMPVVDRHLTGHDGGPPPVPGKI